MPKTFEGDGVVYIQTSEGAFNDMKLENLPVPNNYGTVVGGYRLIQGFPVALGTSSKRYRILWPERVSPTSRKFRSSMFALSSSHSNQTLYVLAEFLRKQGVDFVCLADRNGCGFKPVRLSGSNLAYLPG